jgi:SAM-dependent methyltransferase
VRVVQVPGSGERFDLDAPGGVAGWNRALNRRFAMENAVGNPNPVVRRIERRRRRRIAALAAARPFERALDLGAEDGSLARDWRGTGRRVVLLDVDGAMLARAEGKRVVGDASRLPFPDAAFDLVVAGALLEHLVDPVAAVRECARVVRPGGRIVAWVPWDGAVLLLKRFARLFRIPLGALHEGQAPGHLRRFSRSALRRLFDPMPARIRLEPLSLGWTVEAQV